MQDNFSTDVETAAKLAAFDSPPADRGISWAEAERENRPGDFQVRASPEEEAHVRDLVARWEERSRR